MHHLCAHKVGFDAVLLGAWADFTNAESVLDVGTGSGIIALMAAQKNSQCLVHAIELDENSFIQARENFFKSKWRERLTLIPGDFFEWKVDQKFDHIVTNPPYFINALETPVENRTTARHFTNERFAAFMLKTTEMLNPLGRFTLIIPAMHSHEILSCINHAGYYLSRKCMIYTKNEQKPERILVECRLKKCDVGENKLFIYDKTGQHSAEYRKLTSEFYLNF